MVKVYLFLVLSIAVLFAPSTSAIKQLTDQFAKITGVQIFSSAKESKSAANQTNSKTSATKAVLLGENSTGDQEIDAFIVATCKRYSIDPLLIVAQMKQESGFKQNATSNKGASGLMQLMPATAMRFGVTNIYDPQQNIEAGVKYMRWLLDKFNGDVNLALAGYNAGEGAVMKYNYQIPPYRETQNYVAKITAHYTRIRTNDLIPAALSTVTVAVAAK